MSEFFSQLSAFSIFLGIAAIGFLFLVISLIFGEFSDLFGDTDFDHDAGHGGPGFLSVRVISVFVTAFGGAGAVASYYGLGTLASSGAGFVSGLVFASIVFVFARFLYSQQASTELRTGELVGQLGRVVVRIPAGGMGQVRCQLGEQLIDKIARSADGGPIAENSVVRIEQVLGEVVVVRQET